MFSKELELSIASLFDKAHEANIQYITVEHLLLMILNDYDVKDCLETNNIHIETLKNSIEEHLKKNIVTRIDQSKSVQPTFCLLYTSPSPRDRQKSRMPSSA